MQTAESSHRVLVLAPIGRDGPVIAQILAQAGVPVKVCGSLTDLIDALDEGAAAAFIAEEGLFGKDLAALSERVAAQPPWSDLPFIILTTHQEQSSFVNWRQRLVERLRNVTFQERPLQAITLTSAVKMAVRARVRQYELRTLLTRQEEAAQKLEELVAARTQELEQANDTLRLEMAERARVEEVLRQSQKMEAMGQLTGGIAHDFNNMLQGVTGSLEIAQRHLARGRTAEVDRFLRVSHEAARRAAALTQRLLAFARRQRLDPRPIDPVQLLDGLAELIDRTMGPGIKVALKIESNSGGILCDPNELESALLNLCINARDAMPSGGDLTIGCDNVVMSEADVTGHDGATAGDYIALWVRDTGMGMTSDVLSRVFEPFFTTKPTGQGTGLGLSQVYGFVHQSGGFVRLDSEIGQGTTVRLFLPRHMRQPSSKTLPLSPVEDFGAGEAVLLVDDEEAVRQAVAERLRELAYSVFEAEDGPAAIQMLDGVGHLDLLITDVGLPNGMNGRQLAEAIRERRPSLPVLFITGYSGSVLPPGVEVIAKPFDLDTLTKRVKTLVQSE